MMECTRCDTPIEAGDLRCAVCALVLAAPRAAAAEDVRASVLRCTDCGAAIAFSAEKQAPHCSFCGAVMRIEQPLDPLEQAELRLPFTVERAAAEAALHEWLGRRGWLHPADLVTGARLHKMEALHWAGWVVDARALVSWAADSDHDSGRSAWAPHAGQVTMDFDNIVVPASRGLTFQECAKLTRYYDLATAEPIRAGDEADGVVEEFDAQRSAARRTVLSAIEATAAARLQRGTIPGRRFRNVKVGVFLQGLTTRRVALPAWVLVYRYRGAPHRAVVHGQEAGCVVGRAPYSFWKIAALVAGGLAVIAAIVAAVVLLSR
jgi:hypothetical protein